MPKRARDDDDGYDADNESEPKSARTRLSDFERYMLSEMEEFSPVNQLTDDAGAYVHRAWY